MKDSSLPLGGVTISVAGRGLDLKHTDSHQKGELIHMLQTYGWGHIADPQNSGVRDSERSMYVGPQLPK